MFGRSHTQIVLHFSNPNHATHYSTIPIHSTSKVLAEWGGYLFLLFQQFEYGHSNLLPNEVLKLYRVAIHQSRFQSVCFRIIHGNASIGIIQLVNILIGNPTMAAALRVSRRRAATISPDEVSQQP